MGLDEDERKEIVEIVNDAIQANLDHRELSSPMQTVVNTLARIKLDLYNGEDGKSGFIYEGRTFFTKWTTRMEDSDRRRKQTGWLVVAILTATGIFCVEPIKSAWEDYHSLMDLARKAPVIIRLTDDWEHYYNVPSAPPPPVTIAPKDSQPQPPKRRPSFFAHKKQQLTPQDADGGDHSQ